MVQLLKKVETLQLLVVMANRTGAAKVAEELLWSDATAMGGNVMGFHQQKIEYWMFNQETWGVNQQKRDV